MALRKKKKRAAIVPRAVFAAAVTLGSVPSMAACHGDPAPRETTRRAAELRPLAPPSSPPPPPPHEQHTEVATLEPLDMGVDLGVDAAIDAGADAGRHARRHHQQIRYGVPYPVAAPPPPGVAMRFTVAAPPPGVAVRRFTVAMLDE